MLDHEHEDTMLDHEHEDTMLDHEHEDTMLDHELEDTMLDHEHEDTMLDHEHEDTMPIRNNVNYSGFVGAFAKLLKATISTIMSVCLPLPLSVRMQLLGSH